MVDLPADMAFLLATLPPTPRQQRVALAVVVSLILIVAIALPFGAIELPSFAPVVGSLEILIAGADLINAIVLYSQFTILRWRSLLWLAGCYLYTAIICAVHDLSYPGVVSPAGALGPQTTPLLFIAWHSALPIAIIVCALLHREEPDGLGRGQPTRAAIAVNASTMAAMACGVVCLAMLTNNYLPRFLVDGVHLAPLGRASFGAVGVLIAGALATLWARQRSVLDLWLMVILAVSLIAIVYASLIVGARYTFAFYFVRVYWLISALLIMLVLLSESRTLHARLAHFLVVSRGRPGSQPHTVEAMSASFAHELTQPVAAMVANGEAALLWLSRTPPDLTKVRSSLEQVTGDGRRATEAIASVRAMFQDGAARKERIDINPVVREVMAIESQRLRDSTVQIELDLAEGLPQVLAERAQLQQVLLNLVANAIDAMAPVTAHARVLRVQTRISGPQGLLIAIEDSGSGLSPAASERIFEPFFTTKVQGIGLGLWICRRIIELHGGRLTAAPGAEHGSTFTIMLPGLSSL